MLPSYLSFPGKCGQNPPPQACSFPRFFQGLLPRKQPQFLQKGRGFQETPGQPAERPAMIQPSAGAFETAGGSKYGKSPDPKLSLDLTEMLTSVPSQLSPVSIAYQAREEALNHRHRDLSTYHKDSLCLALLCCQWGPPEPACSSRPNP